VFLIMAILTGVRWNLSVDLICISLINPEILSSTCSSLLEWLSTVFFIWFKEIFISRICV
jgi:hypothetical protein